MAKKEDIFFIPRVSFLMASALASAAAARAFTLATSFGSGCGRQVATLNDFWFASQLLMLQLLNYVYQHAALRERHASVNSNTANPD